MASCSTCGKKLEENNILYVWDPVDHLSHKVCLDNRDCSKKIESLIRSKKKALRNHNRRLSRRYVQHLLHDNQIEATRNAVRKYLLRGLIKCEECGQGFYGGAFNGSRSELTGWYICGGKIAYCGKLVGKCNAQNLNAAWIEEYVWNDCMRFINDP